VILSREATHFIREDEIPEVTFTDASGKPLLDPDQDEIKGRAIALPFVEGRMIDQFDFSSKAWVSGKGRSAVWHEISWERKRFEPQYLMGSPTFEKDKLKSYITTIAVRNKELAVQTAKALQNSALRAEWWLHRTEAMSFMDICSATNARTMYGALSHLMPNGHSSPKLFCAKPADLLAAIVNSFVWDSIARLRTTGLHLIWAVLEECPLPRTTDLMRFLRLAASRLSYANTCFAPLSVASDERFPRTQSWRSLWAISRSERLRSRVAADALAAAIFGVSESDLKWMLRDCDHPVGRFNDRRFRDVLDPKGFWRIDRDKPPEQRHTVLTLVAFQELEAMVTANRGAMDQSIICFCRQNNGEGWMLPETLRLADYGLGHDDRAKEHQPVRARASVPASTTGRLPRRPKSRGANATSTPAICWGLRDTNRSLPKSMEFPHEFTQQWKLRIAQTSGRFFEMDNYSQLSDSPER
jgi:hypothetical protein